MRAGTSPNSAFDVVIVGAALSGAATAVLLLQERPDLKVLLVDRQERFGRRVGEATVEISAYFFRNVLGLSDHLHRKHLVKNGLRFWFANRDTQTIADCAELGGRYLSRLPAYLVDRAVLDEEVLRQAQLLGAQVWRPASVQDIELHEGQEQQLRIRVGATENEVRARWVIDASGIAAVLARRQGWWEATIAHPTAAAWSRWRGVKDFDSLDLRRRFPAWAQRCHGMRSSATNHLMGDGWWAWWIPLPDGDVSIGVVLDERQVDWPTTGALGDRIHAFLQQHPVARELMADATFVEGDVHWRRPLAYRSRVFAGDGFALVGDAAGFLDPFYSPGMDWISFTAWRASRLVLAERRGEPVAEAARKATADFARSYQRWFTAVYQNKYAYMGEFDLMSIAFVMDVGLYYLGLASQPFFRGPTALADPYFATAPSTPFYHLIRTYNRRLATIANHRRARGQLGKRNAGRQLLVRGFAFEPATAWAIGKGLFRWGRLELREGWRTWFQRAPAGLNRAVVAPAELKKA